MKTDFSAPFDKDVSKIKYAKIIEKIEHAILNVETAPSIRNIPRLKKLKGYRIHYRIRTGDYRIGITIEGETVTFVRCLLRRDFYRVFP